MAWSHSIINSTSTKVVIRFDAAADTTTPVHTIPWSDLSSLVSSGEDYLRDTSRDDVYISNIEGSSMEWLFTGGRGDEPDNALDFYWLTTDSLGADETVWIGHLASYSGSKPQDQHLANNLQAGNTYIRGHKGRPEFTGYFSQRGGLKRPAGSTMGNTLDNAFRIELTTTPQAGTWQGASLLITFNVER
jgi:hypothetical protein